MRIVLLLLVVTLSSGLSQAALLERHWQPAPARGMAPSTFGDCRHRGPVTTSPPVYASWINSSATSWPGGPCEPGSSFALTVPPSARAAQPATALQSSQLQHEGETEITLGEFTYGTLSDGETGHYFSYKPAALNVPFEIFIGTIACADLWCWVDMLMNGSPFPTLDNATWGWGGPASARFDSTVELSCEYRNIPLADCEYHYSLWTFSNSIQYFTTVMIPPAGIPEAQGWQETSGTLVGGTYDHYYITNTQGTEIMVFALTATAGECDLYVSTTVERPGPADYMWSSRDEGDDVVIVNGTNAGPGGSRGLYYFIGVYNNLTASSSSYSLMGSGYTTTGNPLSNAWYLQADYAQKDYALANSYRYYYVNIDGVWPNGITITLESLRGDADIYANLGMFMPITPFDPPSLWPNMNNAQYNSTTTGLDQLNISRPTAGYSLFISVYSKDVDSRYSILVTGEGRIAPLYASGNSVTGQVTTRRPQHYVTTIAASSPFPPVGPPTPTSELAESRLTFVLQSLSGNADLYISDTYMLPNATHHNWTSEAAGDGLDLVVLRSYGDQPQLHSGNYFVAVRGSDATYRMWAQLSLRQTLRLNSLLSYHHSGGVIYWEIEVPRNASFNIIAMPADSYYGGSYNVYVGNIAEPQPSVAATYQVMGRGLVRVTPAVSPCQGEGSTCRYYVALERKHAANESYYGSFNMYVSSPEMPPLQLMPDTPYEQPYYLPTSAVFQFNVTCPLSKVTVTLVTSVNQYGGAPMSINRGPLPPFRWFDNVEFGYAETVNIGRRTFVLTFDWTHPLLLNHSIVGMYYLTVTLSDVYSAWMLLVNIDGGKCITLPPFTTMQPLVPYTATANATALTYFSFTAQPSSNRSVYFTLSPLNSSVALSGLSLLARVDGDIPAAGYAQYSSSTGMLRIPASACLLGNATTVKCSYMLAVSSSASGTISASFLLTASLDQPLYAMDGASPTAVLSGALSRNTSTAGTAAITRGASMVSVITESCTGAVSVYLNYRTAAIPTWSLADVVAINVTGPTALAAVITNSSAATHLVASFAGFSLSAATFQSRLLLAMSWSAASPTATSTTLTVSGYTQVPVGFARLRIPLAAVPQAVTAGTIRQPTGSTGQLRYAVYMLDQSVSSDANIRSRCGVTAGAMLVHTAYQLTTSSNTIDVKLPIASHRYTVTVLVDHVWRTAVTSRNYTYEPSSIGYMTYTPVQVRGGTKQPGGDGEDSSSSSGGMVPPPTESSSGLKAASILIIVAVALGVALVAALLGYWYYKRMVVAGGSGGGDSSLPADSFVQPNSQHQQSQQQQKRPTQLTGEAYYALPAGGQVGA